jgi:cytochrome b6-f complex iron-sulfur subunit
MKQNMQVSEIEKAQENDGLTRSQFIKQLGLGSSALMAFYCMGSLSSCTKKADPSPVVPPIVGGGSTKIDFTLDLTMADFKALKTDGEFLIKDAIIIANVGGKYVALEKACTHAGTTVKFRKATSDFLCDNHGSVFADNGKPTKGPATDGLKVYKTEILDSGNKLRVTE